MDQVDDAVKSVDNALGNIIPGEKKPVVAWLLWFFLGGLGGHNFYLGRTKQALMQLGLMIVSAVLTLILIGLLGYLVLLVWWIMDAIKMNDRIAEANAAN